MKPLFYIILFLLLTFNSSRIYSQTMTGFTSPHNNCASAPSVTITAGSNCNPVTSIPSYTTNVIMSDATSSSTGNAPTSCVASLFGGQAYTNGTNKDKWVRIVTGANVTGVAFRTSNFTVGVPTATTGANYLVALYQSSSCPGAINPITMRWSAHTPTGTACTSAAISTGLSASNAPYYIDVNPNTTYYLRIFSAGANAGINFNLEIIPLPNPPANGNNQGANLAAAQAAPCTNAAALTASTTSCNYGALPAPWNS